jgi:hypothetical protein
MIFELPTYPTLLNLYICTTDISVGVTETNFGDELMLAPGRSQQLSSCGNFGLRLDR